MLTIAVVAICVAVKVILLCEPKIYCERLTFYKVIYNSNLFQMYLIFLYKLSVSSAMNWLSTLQRFRRGNMHPSVNSCSKATSSLRPLCTTSGNTRTSAFVFSQCFAYLKALAQHYCISFGNLTPRAQHLVYFLQF